MTEDELVRLDRAFLWHPFTPFDVWLDPAYPVTTIVSGEGATLQAADGRAYLDGNSSIWTNLHGHRHPAITAAIVEQLHKIAHSSFLGLSNDVAPRLAQKLATAITGGDEAAAKDWRVFLSDDGSTAIEAAIKIVYQYFQQSDQPQRQTFVSLAGGYHGDTVGAMSVGHSAAFHGSYRGLLFSSREAMAPYCYRCPYNRAAAEKADARACRSCQWECIDEFRSVTASVGDALAGAVIEPLIQGAAGMIMHPHGYLEKACRIVQDQGGKVILDEVMTGFFRTGALFAFSREEVAPDLVALAKGLTGGYLPLAATVVREEITAAFRGEAGRTFYHGHSYSGNQLGSVAALASLELLEQPSFAPSLQRKIELLGQLSARFWKHPQVGDVRQEGFVLAIELVADFASRAPFDRSRRLGFHVAEAAKKYGLLTRSIGDVLMLMPPYCTTEEQLEQMTNALFQALQDVLPSS
jgi:adenosylmethionine-8-amino-7-oxononanoate aminotransferase